MAAILSGLNMLEDNITDVYGHMFLMLQSEVLPGY